MSINNLEKDIAEIKLKLSLIIDKFDKLEKKLDDLENNKLNNVNESCNRMNEHIDFIHETYSSLYAPLTFIKNKVEYIMGPKDEVKLLPVIKDK